MNKPLKRAIVLVSNDLVTDRRVERTCLILQKAGLEVLLVGRQLKTSLPMSGRPYAVKRLSLFFQSQWFFYAELNIRFFLLLLLKRCDLIYANDLDTLPAAWLVSVVRHRKIIYDSHECYTETPELQRNPFARRIWCAIEKAILPRLKYAVTVNQSIADSYKMKYGVDMQVVKNVPMPRYFPKMQFAESYPSKIILYQGALNVGRALTQCVDAMQYVQNARLLIIGDGDIAVELKRRVKAQKLTERITFLGRIPAEKLDGYTVQADVGLCLLEEGMGYSYYHSLPNRIFDYMHAGIPVLASNLPEIAAVVEQYATGQVIGTTEPRFIANALNELLDKGKEAYGEACKRASLEFDWGKEEAKLLALFSQCL